MAHVAKVKSAGVHPMVGHYNREPERRGFERGNIDGSRTPENYAVGAADTDELARRVRDRISEAVRGHERASGKALRKDANVMMDWVVTAPQDCPEGLLGEFFGSVVEFVQGRYGKENVPGGFVHMDETTPHVHIPVVPVKDGKLVASKVVNRADLRTFHADLGKAVNRALGMHVSIELGDERQGEKQLSHLSQSEYIAAKDEIAATKTRLEHLQREVAELEPAAQGITESFRTLIKGRGDAERERSLESENQQLRERVAGLERDCTEARGRIEQLRERMPGLREQAARAGERLSRAVERVADILRGMRFIPDSMSRTTVELAKGMGVRVVDAFRYQVEQAKDTARAINGESRGYRRQERGHGIGR